MNVLTDAMRKDKDARRKAITDALVTLVSGDATTPEEIAYRERVIRPRAERVTELIASEINRASTGLPTGL